MSLELKRGALLGVALLGLLTACLCDADAPTLAQDKPPERATMTPPDAPSLQASVRSAALERRAPEVTWTLDLELSNPTDQPRWFLFSAELNRPLASDAPLRAAGLYAYQAGGATLLRFYASPPIEAILLGPRAHVTLRGLQLKAFALKRYASLQVGIADGLQLGAGALRTAWLDGRDPTSQGSLLVDASTRREIHEQLHDDYHEDLLKLDRPIWRTVSLTLPPDLPPQLTP